MIQPKSVLFIGLGGAGQRHLRILSEILPTDVQYLAYRHTKTTPFLTPNFSVDDTQTLEETYKLKIFESLESAFDGKPDLTVIATPTSEHLVAMKLALDAESGILVEKPWSASLSGFDRFRTAVLARQLPFLISYQRRYHPLIIKTRDLILQQSIGEPIYASFTIHSNVPAWHPYEDWHSLYAVKRDLGGGVLLTECHEIDLVQWIFGMPDAVVCSGGNRISQDIDVEDTVQIMFLYRNFSVTLNLCFLHPIPSRSFQISGTKGSISWNDHEEKLHVKYIDSPTEEFTLEPGFNNDSMFIAQNQMFLNSWTEADTRESLAAAGNVLAIIESARRSMESGQTEAVIQPF